MKIIISSAKTMKSNITTGATTPVLLSKSKVILDHLKRLNEDELSKIWDVSNNKLNDCINNLNNIDFNNNLTKAIDAYDGVVFRQFNNDFDIDYLNEHLRILSAFYGLLKPSDGICSYRLEMASSLKVNGQSLYQYWDDSLYKEINDKLIINLASEEYGKCIRNYLKEDDVFIDIDFIQVENGKRKHISTELKKARGQFLRWMMINKIEDINQLSKFDLSNYRYSKNDSTMNKLVFVKEIKDMWC